MALTLIITGRTRTKSGPASKPATSLTGSAHNPTGKCVNEHMLKPIGVVKPLERPSCTQLTIEPIKNTNKKLVTADHDLLIQAFLTRFPHYTFVQKVRHTRQAKTKYWFKNTRNGITSVFSKEDAEHEMRKAQ